MLKTIAMRNIILYIAGLLLFSNQLHAQLRYNDLTQEVPFDKSFRKGVLPNGLTYFIRHNKVPKSERVIILFRM